MTLNCMTDPTTESPPIGIARAISREEALEDLLDELRTVLQQLISMQPSKLDVNRIVTQLDAFKKAVQSN